MRLFVCTYLSAGTQAAFRRVCAPLIDRDRSVLRPVPADSLHLTYIFIADLADERSSELGAIAARVAEHRPAFEIRFGQPAILSGGREARLVMAPVAEGELELARLASALASEVRSGIPMLAFKQTDHFHVTLARFRRGTTRGAVTDTADTLQATNHLARERIAQLQVVASQLTTKGPHYTTLRTVDLGT